MFEKLIDRIINGKHSQRELWLEFGFLHRDQNNYKDMCWYNEGRWKESPYFVTYLWKWRKRKDVYFLWRFNGKNHYLRK